MQVTCQHAAPFPDVVFGPKHLGALDLLPFQGFARRSGIQVFRLYSRPSPVTDRNGVLWWAGCPLLTPTMQAGQDSDGGRGGCKCTLRAGVVLCIVFVTMLPDTVDDSSTSTRCLYFRSSQLCLIKCIRDFKGLSYLNLGYSYSSFF
jgi:hypothetical protein